MLRHGQPNYWLTPDLSYGSRLELDLGCGKIVNRYYIRNTHHAHFNEKGGGEASPFLAKLINKPNGSKY